LKLFKTIFFLLTLTSIANAQLKNEPENEKYKTSGVSVSPSHLHLTMKPGDVKTHSITVSNNTDKPEQFQVKILDFDMSEEGKTIMLPAGEGKYSLSKWTNISPTFIQLGVGEKKDINLTISIPSDSSGYIAAWSLIKIELENPREKLPTSNSSDKTIGFGIIPTYAFGVFVYQNPPNVISNDVQIINFSKHSENTVNKLVIEAKNTGSGIAYSTAYVDLTNLTSGKQQRLKIKKFTIIPDLTRRFIFELPKTIEKGKYLAIGVLDYDGSEEIQAAKMKFEIN
jgi:hypothetical protein